MMAKPGLAQDAQYSYTHMASVGVNSGGSEGWPWGPCENSGPSGLPNETGCKVAVSRLCGRDGASS